MLLSWHKRGAASELLLSTVVYVIILIIFSAGMYFYVQQQKERAANWEDYYAKEIVKVINEMKPEDEFVIDVHRATVIAKKQKMDFDKIFSFGDNEMCVQLSHGRKSCYSSFNKINVGFEMKYGAPRNSLILKAEKRERA